MLSGEGSGLYALLSRRGFPKSYLGKVAVVAFVGTHVPLLALVVYLLLAPPRRPGQKPRNARAERGPAERVSGYARVKRWRVYAEEGLARCEVAVRLGGGGMALEHGGRTLSRYDVSLSPEAKLEAVRNPRLFSTPHGAAQLKLFGLEDALGEAGRLKVLRLEGYAARPRRPPEALQQALFPYHEARG